MRGKVGGGGEREGRDEREGGGERERLHGWSAWECILYMHKCA